MRELIESKVTTNDMMILSNLQEVKRLAEVFGQHFIDAGETLKSGYVTLESFEELLYKEIEQKLERLRAMAENHARNIKNLQEKNKCLRELWEEIDE